MKPVDISAEPEKTRTAVHDSVLKVDMRLHRKKDGTIFPVEIAGGYFVQDGRSFHTGIIRGIDERKLAEGRLRESEIKYKLLAKYSADVIYKVNLKDEQFTYVKISAMLTD